MFQIQKKNCSSVHLKDFGLYENTFIPKPGKKELLNAYFAWAQLYQRPMFFYEIKTITFKNRLKYLLIYYHFSKPDSPNKLKIGNTFIFFFFPHIHAHVK